MHILNFKIVIFLFRGEKTELFVLEAKSGLIKQYGLPLVLTRGIGRLYDYYLISVLILDPLLTTNEKLTIKNHG